MSASRRHRSAGDEVRLHHMLDAARRALSLADNKKLGTLEVDSETALALTRLLEILGEAASRVSPELRSRHPEIPWIDLSDTRNKVIHEYFDVDMAVIEAIVRDDLPPLTEQLKAVLEEMNSESEQEDD